jgi:hypothetical protein
MSSIDLFCCICTQPACVNSSINKKAGYLICVLDRSKIKLFAHYAIHSRFCYTFGGLLLSCLPLYRPPIISSFLLLLGGCLLRRIRMKAKLSSLIDMRRIFVANLLSSHIINILQIEFIILVFLFLSILLTTTDRFMVSIRKVILQGLSSFQKSEGNMYVACECLFADGRGGWS